MSRYIDAEWLKQNFKRGKDYKGEYVLDDLKYDAPSIEIIRCGVCAKRMTDDCPMCNECNFGKVPTEDDDFCSYGERDKDTNVLNKTADGKE